MLGAVNYLHTMDVCHRDLKLENFIFTEKGPAGEIKMIDFGFSKHYLHKEHMHEVPRLLRQLLMNASQSGDTGRVYVNRHSYDLIGQ